jgi:hypothetical protein
VAKKDIVCYKVLRLTNPFWNVSRFETFYTCDPIPEKIISGELDFIAEGNVKYNISECDLIDWIFCGKYEIDKGQIHTCKTLRGVKMSFGLDTDDMMKNGNVAVFKCIIPKGTKFYKGKFKTLNCLTIGVKSYCSDKIRFVEQVI